jgi:AraC-like DNA-binding protein
MTPNDLSLRISRALDGCPPATVDLFDRLLTAPEPIITGKHLAALYGMHVQTLQSRFLRAGLVSVKEYIVFALCARAALLFDDPARTASDVAWSLGYSSPQAFGRMLKTYRGHTTRTFRTAWSGAAAVEQYITKRLGSDVQKLRTAHLVGERGS